MVWGFEPLVPVEGKWETTHHQTNWREAESFVANVSNLEPWSLARVSCTAGPRFIPESYANRMRPMIEGRSAGGLERSTSDKTNLDGDHFCFSWGFWGVHFSLPEFKFTLATFWVGTMLVACEKCQVTFSVRSTGSEVS